MIFATVGSSRIPFDRFLCGFEGLSQRVLIQSGPSKVRPKGADCVAFMSFDEMTAAIEQADAVVTHAGVGSIMVALMHGKQPLVVPRRRQFGEAVDDHQVPFARRLADIGLVTLVEDPGELATVLPQAGSNGSLVSEDGNLVRELRAYIRAQVDVRHEPEP